MSQSSSKRDDDHVDEVIDSSGVKNISVDPVDETFLLNKGTEIIRCFNQLFGDIAPICKYGISVDESDVLKVKRKMFTPIQLQTITQLSGFIGSLAAALYEKKLDRLHIENKFAADRIPFKLSEIDKASYDTTLLNRRIFLLQDYLLKEVKANEELEAKIRVLEETIVGLNEKRRNKKLSNIVVVDTVDEKVDQEEEENLENEHDISVESEGLAATSVDIQSVSDDPFEVNSSERKRKRSSVDSSSGSTGKFERLRKNKKGKSSSIKVEPPTDPLAYLGRWIRKLFDAGYYFGVISDYDEETGWHVVYEDSDHEDLSWSEIHDLLWDALVPRDKMERAYRHARNLKLLHESLQHVGLNPKVARLTPSKNPVLSPSSSIPQPSSIDLNQNLNLENEREDSDHDLAEEGSDGVSAEKGTHNQSSNLLKSPQVELTNSTPLLCS